MRFASLSRLLILAGFMLLSSGPCPAADASDRHFRTGFTGFPHDFSVEAFIEAQKFCRENGDIIAHHIEGVPWAEMLSEKPFSAELLKDWNGKRGR